VHATSMDIWYIYVCVLSLCFVFCALCFCAFELYFTLIWICFASDVVVFGLVRMFACMIVTSKSM
jgi:hypothetical protein